MDVRAILAGLYEERENIDRAISTFETMSDQEGATRNVKGRRGRGKRHMSPEARKKIGLGLSRRWAEKKRLAVQHAKKADKKVRKLLRGYMKTEHTPKKRTMNAAARAKIAKAAKERWAKARAANPGARNLAGA